MAAPFTRTSGRYAIVPAGRAGVAHSVGVAPGGGISLVGAGSIGVGFGVSVGPTGVTPGGFWLVGVRSVTVGLGVTVGPTGVIPGGGVWLVTGMADNASMAARQSINRRNINIPFA